MGSLDGSPSSVTSAIGVFFIGSPLKAATSDADITRYLPSFKELIEYMTTSAFARMRASISEHSELMRSAEACTGKMFIEIEHLRLRKKFRCRYSEQFPCQRLFGPV